MLTQAEADGLLAVPKALHHPMITIDWGDDYRADVESDDGKERFFLDVSRKTVKFSYKNQLRARTVVILARLCVEGPPHRNPDMHVMGTTHLHLYREGDDDRWAFPLPASDFSNVLDPVATLSAFCTFVNIQNAAVQTSLLSGGPI